MPTHRQSDQNGRTADYDEHCQNELRMGTIPDVIVPSDPPTLTPVTAPALLRLLIAISSREPHAETSIEETDS